MVITAASCAGEVGDACRIDSDCGDGMLCTSSGRCDYVNAVVSGLGPRHFGVGDVAVEIDNTVAFDAGFTIPDPVDEDTGGIDGADGETAGTAGDGADGSDGADSAELQTSHSCGADEPWLGVPTECSAQTNAFAAQEECPAVTGVYMIRSMVMEAYGGLTTMAPLANPIIEQSIFDGLVITMSVDGSFSQACDFDLVWSTGEPEYNDDCTTQYGSNMPVPIEGILDGPAILRQIKYDWATGTLEGIVIKAELMSVVPEVFRDTASGLVQEDLDLDGDGVNESVSSKFSVCLTPYVPATPESD